MTTSVNGKSHFDSVFIGIAGMIGAGKSTLATALGKQMGLDVYYEPVDDNEYLADFYRDTARYSFATQIYLLNRRFQQHQEIIWKGRPAIQDRTIYEDAIFAKMLSQTGLMEPRDYRTYLQLFKHMSNFMCKPTAIVYLDVKPARSMERIQQRSRGVESGISLQYLEALYGEYENWVHDISRRIPTVRVDWDQYKDVDEMAEVVRRETTEHSFLRSVGP
jgi:deoxyadenosine kinase